MPAAGNYERLAELTRKVDALIATPAVIAAKPSGSEKQLHAQVLDHPSDVETIRVWADALLEAGDERGTFVMTQLLAEERPLTAKEQKLEAQLLKANRLKWIGKAGSAIDTKTATFRRSLLLTQRRYSHQRPSLLS